MISNKFACQIYVQEKYYCVPMGVSKASDPFSGISKDWSPGQKIKNPLKRSDGFEIPIGTLLKFFISRTNAICESFELSKT